MKIVQQSSLAETSVSLTRRGMLLAPTLLGFSSFGHLAGFAHAAVDPRLAGSGKPVRGGTLTRVLIADPPNFNTFASAAGRVISVVGPCCNGLVRYDSMDPDKIVMDLAESFSVSSDGMAYTFQLRKGLKFHDGKPCTSEDVKFTFDLMRNPPSGMVSIRASLLEAVDSILAPTPHTVIFILKRRSPSLIANLAGGWMLVLPKHILEKGPMTDVVIGTGPFKLKEYKRGVSVELVRNPEYHIPDRPFLDGIKYFIIPDENTAFGYLRTGQIDEWLPATAVTEDKIKELANKAYLVSGISTSSHCISFNAQVKPFDDVRVRKAVCLALNRKEALDTTLKGLGVATAGWAMPGKWALPKAQLEKIPAYGPWKPGNIAEAKALLTAAGLGNGFQETLLVQRVPAYEPHAVYIKDKLLQIGIDLKLEFQDTAKYSETLRKRLFTIEAGGAPFQVNDPDSMFAASVVCGGNMNYSKLCDPRTDELVSLQSQELDEKKRIALVNELESRVLSQYGTFKMYFKDISRVQSTKIYGWGLHPNADNATRFEDVWRSK